MPFPEYSKYITGHTLQPFIHDEDHIRMIDENDSSQPKSTGIDLAPLFPPLDIETEHAGMLRIGPLNTGVLIDVATLLESVPSIPETSLAKSMMLKMVKNQPTDEGAEGSSLTSEQKEQITEGDVRRFAEAVLKRERVKDIIDESGAPLSPEIALVRYIREWNVKITEPMKRWNTALGSGFLTASTRNALGDFKLHRAIADSMRAPAWLSETAVAKGLMLDAERVARATAYPGGAIGKKLMEDVERLTRATDGLGATAVKGAIVDAERLAKAACIPDLAIAKGVIADAERLARAADFPGAAAIRSSLAETATGRLAGECERMTAAIKYPLAGTAMGRLATELEKTTAAFPQSVPRPNLGAEELCETIRNNNPSRVLGEKLDELKDAIGNGTELTERLLSDSVAATREHIEQAKAQGQTDSQAQQKATWWAVGGIAVSACLGLASLVVSCQSYSHDLAVEESAAKERSAPAPKEEERLQLLREQIAVQQEQNKLLRELLAKPVKQHRSITQQK